MSNSRAAFDAARAFAWLALLWVAGCLNVREEAFARDESSCASCHGMSEPERPGLLAAAPPSDLMGNTAAEYPGVGAHSAHLSPSPDHGAIACDECHRVPESTNAPGHIDSVPPAEIEFGALARSGGEPTYDAAARRCADTYCHGALSPPWTQPPAPEAACANCHGLPPPPPHPQSERCGACHSDVIDVERSFIDPERHVDGSIDVVEAPCDSCHGASPEGAPPPSLVGDTSARDRGVGAHSAHLGGGQSSRPVACAECHRVPEPTSTSSHPEGGAALVAFSGVALTSGFEVFWDGEQAACSGGWCHDPSRRSDAVAPVWTLGSPLSCTDCHGMPPAPPHAQVADCGLCHAGVVERGAIGIAQPELHVNGSVDVGVSEDCTACHGSDTPAPPTDLAGNSDGSAPGVGAHAAHILPEGPARRVLCAECHVVPESVFAAGHVDTLLPAEVRFSGVATAFEAVPSYASGTCSATYCHGDSFIGGRPSGGTDTQPTWVQSDSTPALTCQSCHGMPPPAPHPQEPEPCSTCHRNIDATQSFTAADTHVDGTVTFFLP